MTAEAIVMNRWAVAMAADSAVTIDSSTAGPKIYNSANKLFELIRGSSVGVMVYNAAEINSTPWETVIKGYRNENPNFSAATVDDYADHFLHFVAGHTGLLRPADEHVAAIGIAWNQITRWVLDELVNWPEPLQSETQEVIQPNMNDALDVIINSWQYEIDSSDDADISNAARKSIRTQFYAPISVFAEEFLAVKAVPASVDQINAVADLAFASLTKNIQDPGGTGLVFAGFGTEEYFPSMVSTQITARFCGEVLRYETARAEISAAERGHWETFAQDGPALGWANGIHEIVRDAVMDEWGGWVTETLSGEVEKKLRDSGLSEKDAAGAADVVGEIAEDQLAAFGEYMDDLEEVHFRGPMKASIEVLPKDELALLAESLVNLTSLRQRMSVDEQNTVGGPIDVAVISPGDGFVWLKRKHYFEADLNPTWHLTHGATIRTYPQRQGDGLDDQT